MLKHASKRPPRFVHDLEADPPEELRPPAAGTPAAAILTAARVLFAERGFAGASTRAIAESAGVNLAMIHYYFGNKERLYRRVLGLEFVDLFRIIRESVGVDAPPHELLLAMPECILQLHREHPHLMRLILREMSDGATRLPRMIEELGDRGPRGLHDLLGETLSRARQDGFGANIPDDHLLAILFSIGNGLRAFAPLIATVFGLDLDDPSATAAMARSVQALLRRALEPVKEG
jgi:TetR/AcrR family transcriptional regulator